MTTETSDTKKVTTSRLRTCRECNGQGYLPNLSRETDRYVDEYPCEACSGEGQVPIRTSTKETRKK